MQVGTSMNMDKIIGTLQITWAVQRLCVTAIHIKSILKILSNRKRRIVRELYLSNSNILLVQYNTYLSVALLFILRLFKIAGEILQFVIECFKFMTCLCATFN